MTLRVSTILERIRAECPAFAQVDHALTSAAQNAYPAAFVAVSRISAAPNKTLGAHVQDTTWLVRVYVVAERRQDGATGYGVADAFDDALAQLRDALIGWKPTGAGVPFNLAGGELAERDGLACWAEDYATTILMRT